VWNIGNSSVHNMPEVTLNLPGRDQKIEEYKNYLRNLGKAGIYYTTYAHMGNGIWSSGRAKIRGAPAREFDMASPNKEGTWAGQVFREPLSHGRVFTPEEIWDNYTYFSNVSAPLPHFVETFMDNGYYDMWKIMKALREVNFDGIVILDHSPVLVGNTYAQTAYGVAYMRALLKRANAPAES